MIQRTIEELERDDREKLVVDLRSREEYEKETYPGAVNIYWKEFEEHIAELPKDKPVYLICHTGQTSNDLAIKYADQGYEMYSIENGYHSYLRQKLEHLMDEETVVTDKDEDKE